MTTTLLILASLISFPKYECSYDWPAPIVIQADGRLRVKIYIFYRFRGTSAYLEEVGVITKDRRFAEFLSNCKDQTSQWIEDLSKRYTCYDIWKPKDFFLYEREIGKLLRAKYLKKTNHRVPLPDILGDIVFYASRPTVCYIY